VAIVLLTTQYIEVMWGLFQLCELTWAGSTLFLLLSFCETDPCLYPFKNIWYSYVEWNQLSLQSN